LELPGMGCIRSGISERGGVISS